MPKIIDQYNLEQSIGVDPLGFEIYRAKHMITKQYYMLKSINTAQFSSSKQFQEGILNEAKLLKKLDHVNILKFVKMLKTIHNVYLVYQFCSEGSLFDKIKYGKPTQAEQTSYMRQLVIGVRQIHKKQIIHLNLNPKNILIGANNNIKITGFNYSRVFNESNKEENIFSTLNQEVYVAPEIKRKAALTLKSDIYSMGILFYFIKYGKVNEIPNSFSQEKHDPNQQLIREMVQNDPQKRISLQDINFNLIYQSKSPKTERQIKVKEQSDLKIITLQHSSSKLQVHSSPPKNREKLLSRQTTKKSEKELSRNQSETKSIISQWSDKSEQKVSETKKKIISERNKYHYLSIIINAVIDLDVNELSSKLSLILFKKARIIGNKLAYMITRGQTTAVTSVKQIKNTQEQDIFKKIIIKQIQQLNQSFKAFKTIIQQEKKLLTDKSFEVELMEDDLVNQSYSRRIIREYISLVLSLANSNDEDKMLRKRYQHLNNVADCLNLDKFFEQYMNEEMLKISEQVYFTQIEKLDLKELKRLVSDKII